MPRRSLVPWSNRFLTLAVLSLVITWGLSLGLVGGLARAAHLEIEVPDRSRLAQSMATADLAQQPLPSQFLPNLAQAPATPDTNPAFGDPAFGDSIAQDDPGLWIQIFWSLLRLLMPLLLPLVIGGIAFWQVKRWLDKQRPKCDICGVLTTLHNRKEAKPYLNPAQQIEADLDSVFYSVAICPQCTRRKVFRFVAPNRLVTQCPRCHYKTMAITQQKTTTKPTPSRPGEAIIHRTCRYCGYTATATEVLSANKKSRSQGLYAFLDDDWGLDSLREGYRDPRDVNPSPPDDSHNAGE